jgi:hypothetical protein
MAIGHNSCCFYRRAHRTVRCTPNSLVPRPCQPTVKVCSSRPLESTVGQTVWGTPNIPVLQRPRVLGCGPLYTDYRTVWCTLDMSSAPPEHLLTGLFLDFFTIFLGLFYLESWTSTHLLCLLLRCCILRASVKSSSHPMNYKHKH